jgi:glycosyltransferase involved in cell wall biosynthesis
MNGKVKMGMVSVVIPTFNQVNFIDDTLEIVVNQTYSDLEIIVCDDYSDDGTEKKILEWANRDSRIIVILSDKNQGLSINLNKGLDRVKGEFLSLMGGDDKMAPEKISRQVDFMRTHHDYDVVLHWVEVFDSATYKTLKIFNSNILKSPIDWFLPKVSFGISKKTNNSVFPPTAYLARSQYALHSRYDYRLRFKNEVLFAIDNYMNKPAAKWHCIPEVLGYYRMHENNMHKSKEMNEALLEETYINYAIASARYPSLNRKMRRALRHFLYMELYYLGVRGIKKDESAFNLAKTRFEVESDFFQYWIAILFLKAKLFYRKIKN